MDESLNYLQLIMGLSSSLLYRLSERQDYENTHQSWLEVMQVEHTKANI